MRTYIRTSEAWYASANRIGPGHEKVEEFILQQGQHGDPEDVPQIELTVRWNKVPDGAALVGVYDESWEAFALWNDLWLRLAQEAGEGGGMAKDFSCGPDEFKEILEACGFKDRTPREAPGGYDVRMSRGQMLERLDTAKAVLAAETPAERRVALALDRSQHDLAEDVRLIAEELSRDAG